MQRPLYIFSANVASVAVALVSLQVNAQELVESTTFVVPSAKRAAPSL